MAAPKGNNFNPAGRPDGAKNKKTIQWEVFSEYCLNGGLQRFEEELTKLAGREYVDSFIKLLEFHKPKLSRSALTDGDGKSLFPKPIVDVRKNNGISENTKPKPEN